jgi:hypothetical protein
MMSYLWCVTPRSNQRMASIHLQHSAGREFALQYEYVRFSDVGDRADAAGRQARGHLRPDFLLGIPGDLIPHRRIDPTG